MRRDGIQIPEDIATQPTLPSNLLGYLDAFYDLDTERNHGQGLARIPWSKITYYGEFYRYDLDELHYFIRKMDDALLADMAEGLKSGRSAGSGETVQRPPRPD
jgi:hypothetical protein